MAVTGIFLQPLWILFIASITFAWSYTDAKIANGTNLVENHGGKKEEEVSIWLPGQNHVLNRL